MSAPGDRVLGAYRLVERIGRGGMGEVYRARHLRLGREAAVKVLPAHLVGEADFLRRFEREAASVAALEHPHILPVWDYGEQDGAPYLVMPLVRGGSLKERLERGPLPREEAVRYLRQAADALDYAHGRGLVHRDVKPANLLLDGRGGLYLADFGVARALEGADGLTRAGVGVGTPEYMAPEQAQGQADPRSDLYALGVVAYQMLTGRVPYGGASAVEVLMKHLREPLPLEPLRGATPPLPAGVEAVVGRALAKDPDERYQSGRALVEALGEALAGNRSTPATAITRPGDAPTAIGSAPAGGWQQPVGPRPVVQTPPPGWQSGGTPPPNQAAPVYAPTPPLANRGNRKPLLVGGIVGALALALLVIGVVIALLGRQGGGVATATAAPVVAAASPSPPGATATAPPAAPTATAVPTAAPTAAPTAPPTVAPTAAAYPGGGKYTTLEPVARRGGRFTHLAYEDAQTLNPLIATDTPSGQRIALLFNALVQTNPDTGQPFPDLAEAVPTRANGGIAPDGLAYTFRLRRDVKWHDGRPFTARDVLYTYATLANRELGSPAGADLNERVEAVTAPNDFTVVFRLKRPVAPFLTDNMYAIVPEHILRDVPVGQLRDHPFSTGDARATVGTGPFRFQEWLRNNQLTLAKNPNYFLGEPALDSYTFKVFKSSTNDDRDQLKAGGFDFSEIAGDLYGELSRQPKLTVLTYDSYAFEFYAYQLDPAKTTLFADKRVRQALAYAVDRDALVKELLAGFGTVAQGTMAVPSWAYAPEQIATKYAYDPRRAEQLLDEAGWRRGPDGVRARDGRKLSFTVWGTATSRDLFNKLQAQWKAIGVDATLRTESFNGFLARITQTHDFEMFLGSFTTGVDPDQTALWATSSYPNGFNFARYTSPRVDALLAQGLEEFDREKRRQIYIEMQNIVVDDLPINLLSFGQTAVAINKRVHNLKPNAINSTWNAHTWWVDDGR